MARSRYGRRQAHLLSRVRHHRAGSEVERSADSTLQRQAGGSMNQQSRLCEDRLLSLRIVLGDYLPIGKTTLFALIKNDKLKVIKLGRRTFIRHSTVQAYIDSLENAA